MMYIIADSNSELAVSYLVEHTDKRFCWKQLLELSQLISSADISNQMKKINRGKELQAWIKDNPCFTYHYYKHLFNYCIKNINMKNETVIKLKNIENDLLNYMLSKKHAINITNAIFRYKQEYNSEHTSNTLLPIKEACFQYKKYIETYKFPKQNS